MSNINPGKNIGSINAESIRLRARFTRVNPSTTPSLDRWSVSYYGKDEEPPVTHIKSIDGVKGLNDYYISEGVTIWLTAEDYPADTGSTIKIDAKRPYVEITSPANEEQLEVPFWVHADASDNVEIDRVEFDIEPFGEHEGLPYKDYDPPYEWYCDIQKTRSIIPKNNPPTTGQNVMIRAQVFDKSGQTWIHEIWVYIKNWQDKNPKMEIKYGRTLDVEIETPSNADAVLFTVTKTINNEKKEIWDNDFNDGCKASFDVPTGVYEITATSFANGEELDTGYAAEIFYVKQYSSTTLIRSITLLSRIIKILNLF